MLDEDKELVEEGLDLKPKKKTRRKRTKKGTELYIDKNEMMDELLHYNKTGEISEKLGAMFLKLAIRYTSKPNLSGYSYREEFIGSGVLRMISQIDKFDVDHPSKNPFAYFTQVIHNETMGILNREKRQRDIKADLRDKLWSEVASDQGLDDNSGKSNVDSLS
jgi:DNA-directed RNA polymerase specialized sigma24 family protein